MTRPTLKHFAFLLPTASHVEIAVLVLATQNERQRWQCLESWRVYSVRFLSAIQDCLSSTNHATSEVAGIKKAPPLHGILVSLVVRIDEPKAISPVSARYGASISVVNNEKSARHFPVNFLFNAREYRGSKIPFQSRTSVPKGRQ
jgi:hypothetical protein